VPCLEFFWDVGSPYTYLASTQLDALRERTAAEVRWRPFLLGGVFKGVGNTMPASVLAKAQYMKADLRRWSARYGVKILVPPDEVIFPINSLTAMRCAVAAERAGFGAGVRFAKAAFSAYWTEGRDLSQPGEVQNAAAAAGIDGATLLAASSEQAVKDELRANTEEAIRRGAFGAPALFIGEELYWGNDRLDFVERRLRELS
jgi:2-hydroxychromene-2-carboxylate isomerase